MRRVKFLRRFAKKMTRPIVGILVFLLLLPFVLFAGNQAIKLYTAATVVPANIVVDASKSQARLSRPWGGLSQGGEQEAPGQLVSLAPVATQVRSLGVRYIRIDHVLEQPFDNLLRQRITDITNAGAIPFISLSYFPSDVASSDVGTVYNWALWQAKVRNLVSEVSGRDGLNISGVYYEVWNEPDGENFGGFNIGYGKDYFTLYQKTVEAAQSAPNVNPFKIGGPALADLRRCTNGLLFICQSYFLDRFLGLVVANSTRLDFISWHRYATKISDYNDDINFILSLYTKYSQLPPVEKIITEWGTVPERSGVHGTVFDAAHLVSAVRAFIGYVDLATKFEIRDGPGSGDKGWGILDHSGNPKPTFEALRLLNFLRSERVLLTGEGSYVSGIASRDSSGVSVILANFDPAGAHVESVPVRISGLSAGKYRLTRYTINGVHPFGFSETTSLSTTNGSYTTVETMPAESVVLYDFQLVGLLGQ